MTTTDEGKQDEGVKGSGAAFRRDLVVVLVGALVAGIISWVVGATLASEAERRADERLKEANESFEAQRDENRKWLAAQSDKTRAYEEDREARFLATRARLALLDAGIFATESHVAMTAFGAIEQGDLRDRHAALVAHYLDELPHVTSIAIENSLVTVLGLEKILDSPTAQTRIKSLLLSRMGKTPRGSRDAGIRAWLDLGKLRHLEELTIRECEELKPTITKIHSETPEDWEDWKDGRDGNSLSITRPRLVDEKWELPPQLRQLENLTQYTFTYSAKPNPARDDPVEVTTIRLKRASGEDGAPWQLVPGSG